MSGLAELIADTQRRLETALDVVREARRAVEARTLAIESLVSVEPVEPEYEFDPDFREPDFDDPTWAERQR